MGYTHYWGKQGDVDEASYAAALKDIAKIVTSEKAMLANGSGDEGSKPKISGGISFNGIGDESHETFSLPSKAKMLDNDFCKTNRKPYDVVVVAALSRLAEVAGIKVGSDGNEEELKDGVALASKVLGRKVKNPMAVKLRSFEPGDEPDRIPKSKPALKLVKSFVSRVHSSYKVVAVTMMEAAKKLGLNTSKIDFAIPQDFLNDMLKLYPNENIHWAGVWSYEDEDTTFGSPRPLTKHAQDMLKKYNEHYKTKYPTNYKVID